MTPAPQPQGEYQCSWCKRNKFNGDDTCPLNLEGSNGNSDIFDGVNRVIKSCGCGAFIDTRSRPAPSPEEKPCDHCDFQERDEREFNIARQAAAQARDKTILEIWEHIKGHCDPMTEDYFESLRTEAHK